MGIDTSEIRERIRDIPDFPRPGVVFKDITPLLADGAVFGRCVDALAEPFADRGVDKVLGMEARGFIVAAPIAVRLGAGFVPLRKAGKLPWTVRREEYLLEYATDALEVHADAVAPGERVLIIDDVLATGGTATTAVTLASDLGAETVGFGCVLELAFLGGRRRLLGTPAGVVDGAGPAGSPAGAAVAAARAAALATADTGPARGGKLADDEVVSLLQVYDAGVP
jgi:adenine phosphoribosyltransferase